MSQPSQVGHSTSGCYPPGDGLDYVRRYYGVVVALGQRVACNGKPGTVIHDPRFPSHYVHVEFDDGQRCPCHPTWEMDYSPEAQVQEHPLGGSDA